MRSALVMSMTVGVLLAVAAPASATPASVNIDDYAFLAPDVRIAPGEAVTWHFRGQDQHNVKSDPGQAETFLSGLPRAGGPDFVRRFDKVGRFTYTCELHPEMIGSVQVAVPDTTAPSLIRLSASPSRFCVPGRGCRHPGTRLRFRLSERSTVRGSIATVRRPGRRLRRLKWRLGAGRQSLRIRGRGLRPGRYLVRVQAFDGAGNRSITKTVRMRIKKP